MTEAEAAITARLAATVAGFERLFIIGTVEGEGLLAAEWLLEAGGATYEGATLMEWGGGSTGRFEDYGGPLSPPHYN
jgi:hypothetical protein